MQATVATYDTTTRSGTLLDDDGASWVFGAETLAHHVLHLRAGQRVHIDVDDGLVTHVRIW